MSTISTISELLSLSQCQYRIYDLGRKIEKISKSDFDKIEQTFLPFPSPILGHAHLAICFWQKQSTEPYLWFVKLPLDERGLLNQGARNHFLAIIIEALGSDLSVDPNEKQQELLSENPYIFTPAQYKLAMLNSLLSVELKKPASKYFSNTINYLKQSNFEQWQDIGVQGLTDLAARLTENNNAELLAKALPSLPLEVLNPLAGALENCSLPLIVITTILHQLQHSDITADKKQLLLRALASSTENSLVDDYFALFLQQETLSEEEIIITAGRCWKVLNSNERNLKFLEIIVKSQAQLFPAIFKDLVAIPKVRPLIFQCMREPQRSNELASAIGQLFNQQR